MLYMTNRTDAGHPREGCFYFDSKDGNQRKREIGRYLTFLQRRFGSRTFSAMTAISGRTMTIRVSAVPVSDRKLPNFELGTVTVLLDNNIPEAEMISNAVRRSIDQLFEQER